MFVTEKKARDMWCPEIFYNDKGTINRDRRFNKTVPKNNDIVAPSNCIGSKCMFWRWQDKNNGQSKSKIPMPKGYCGLASRPPEEQT